MPTEDELRDLLGRQDAPNRLDPKRIVRSSRARRIPQQIAAGGAGVLAVAGITVLGIQVIPFGQLSRRVADGRRAVPGGSRLDRVQPGRRRREAAARRPHQPLRSGRRPSPSRASRRCSSMSSATGQRARRHRPGRRHGADDQHRHEPVTGTSPSAPAVTLSQDGITLWHSNGPVDASAVLVDLDPGESMDYAATFIPVRCAPEDDTLDQFPARPPRAPAGRVRPVGGDRLHARMCRRRPRRSTSSWDPARRWSSWSSPGPESHRHEQVAVTPL